MNILMIIVNLIWLSLLLPSNSFAGMEFDTVNFNKAKTYLSGDDTAGCQFIYTLRRNDRSIAFFFCAITLEHGRGIHKLRYCEIKQHSIHTLVVQQHWGTKAGACSKQILKTLFEGKHNYGTSLDEVIWWDRYGFKPAIIVDRLGFSSDFNQLYTAKLKLRQKKQAK